MNDEYYKKKYTFDQRFYLGLAFECLAKAMGSSYAHDVDMEVMKGIKYLIEFINGVKPTPKMSREAIDFSSCAHTYLRKYSDSPNTTLLYNLVSNRTGYGIWVTFCEAMVKTMKDKKFNWRDVQNEVRLFYDENCELPDNLIMWCALRTWMKTEEVDLMVKTFNFDEELGYPGCKIKLKKIK